MSFYPISTDNPLQSTILQEIANACSLNEISNANGSVRHHLFWFGHRDKSTNKLQASMLFFVYQTTRHGPQNGFRLCLAHRGFYIASPTKIDGEPEDDIDRLEKPIPQRHMEVVILGDSSTANKPDDGEDYISESEE